MLRKITKLSLLPVLALALLVAGCDQAAEVTGPGVATSPLLSGGDDNGFTVVKEKDVTVGAVTGVIGSGGGKLVLGKHELWVPRDAVSSATTFTMSKASDELRFSLTATQVLPNDVGSAGFAQPVKLVVSFQDATSVVDPSLLRVFWSKLDGSFVEQPTSVDLVGKKAIGELGHFSEYVLAMP